MGADCESDNPVPLLLTRADVADYLGLTIETVSRTPSGLKHAGLFERLFTVTTAESAAVVCRHKSY